MSGRNFTAANGYRYGFNGKEKDDEVKGNGNSYDFGSRIYDPRLGRWLSVDPLAQKYPAISPYVFCLNNPMRYIDMDGKWAGDVNVIIVLDGSGEGTTLKQGDWTIIHANSTEQAIAIMGSKEVNIGKSSGDNMLIMQHGQGGDLSTSAIAIPQGKGQMLNLKDLNA